MWLITRQDLQRAQHEGLVRLARWLGLRECGCLSPVCRERLIDATFRRLRDEFLKRDVPFSGSWG